MKAKLLGLNIIYPLLAVIYIATMSGVPYRGHYLVKALPIIFLACLVFWFYFKKSLNTQAHFLFGMGFVFSSFGDITLASTVSNSFVIGLGFFLIAHICYIAAFLRMNRVRFVARKGLLSGVLIFGGVMAFMVLPTTGEYQFPVTIYLLVITTMGCFSLVQRENFLPFFMGALIFMVSDGIIAINKFVEPVPHASLWIMATYYIAQGLMARGILTTSCKE